MPRCVVCDYCSETDGNDFRSFQFVPEERGDVCGRCRDSIHEVRFDFLRKDYDENRDVSDCLVDEDFDRTDLGNFDFLEVGQLEGDPEEDAGG